MGASARVVVVGGGPSGIAAALAAARLGARVTLLERHSFVGGNMTFRRTTCARPW
jgi:phytoene dehydrogenase-like protein